MSHFNVLVIGSDVEKQLAPYHEFECTGKLDEFVVDVDITEEIQASINGGETLESALSDYGLEEKIVSSEGDANREGNHKFGFAVVVDGKLIKAVDRTNPNKKWDWWQVGGRWRGYLLGKDGKQHDSLTVAELDLEGMIATDLEHELAIYRPIQAAIAGREYPLWNAYREEKQKEGLSIDQIRAAYNDIDVVKAVKGVEAVKERFFFNVEPYLAPEDQFVATVRAGALSTYAIVKDSQWYQKGEMGWFGMSSGEVTQDEWNAKVAELIAGLSPDTLLTVVDCHI